MSVIRDFFPNFSKLSIHESSPSGRGVSVVLKQQCSGYSYSHYFPEVGPGNIEPQSKTRCENLEALTFADSTFDLFVTQDVMEHVFKPEAAFREISRVLKPGGAHIFTVPLVNKTNPSRRRASRLPNGKIVHHCDAQYHGNPVDPSGSLVTMDWGFDISFQIQQLTNMPTIIFKIDDINLGIRAEYIEVLLSLNC